MIPYRIYSFLKILLFILTSHSLLTRKKPIRFCIAAFILNSSFVFLSGIYLLDYIHNEGIYKIIMYLVTFSYIIYFSLVFKESLSKKVFTFFSILMFSTITLFIASPAAELISRINDVSYTQDLIYIFRNIINFFFLLTAYFWAGRHYKNILNLVSDKTIRYMALYPALAFLLLVTNFTTPARISQLDNFNTIYHMILFLLFMVVGYILVLLGIASASKIVSMQYSMEKLEIISKTDSLTGLYNRRYIIEKLENELMNYNDTGNKFSVILADIDYFKNINDSFGHDCGDQVLKRVSQNLRDTVQEKGVLSRWGGEEFLILLPETELDDAMRLAYEMRRICEEKTIDYYELQIPVTLTFGVTSNGDNETIDDTIRKADYALYEGKNRGRNCVVSS